jgi:methionyl-tRNA formyltransferase
MKIVIITQDDQFVIPQNIQRIIDLPGVQVARILILNIKGSLSNRKLWFAKGFGLWQSMKMVLLIVWSKILDVLDRLTGFKKFSNRRSISAIAVKYRISLRIIKDPNSSDILDMLRATIPDLIVSFSAPCVFKPELLNIPKFGCINLHCSYLPKYAGLLPSFWVLFKGERETGATVHYMDERIDNGTILMQEIVPIDPGISMFALIKKTKNIGGQLVAKVITKLQQGSLPTIPNNSYEGTYYSWPTIEEMREFRKHGGCLI